ncbi:Kinesin-like protein KIN-5D [Glycine soja]
MLAIIISSEPTVLSSTSTAPRALASSLSNQIQTGTGKTYTMEGGARKKNAKFSSNASVIPKAMKLIFDVLEAQNADYNMKETYCFNGGWEWGVFARGLEEEIVCTANEIYKILEKGSAKRRTTKTLLNKQSNHSHSIFSITIHIKKFTLEGEKMIKYGKLNLVNLTRSKNILRSGARDSKLTKLLRLCELS